ncbi:MAG: hypothetical protein M3O94_01830, partial [Actinomycetota bacterium]|nr:hypothetical protein [Actinomycetota bacterium]
PVQWEDNLPQVATEMVAHGVPLITSHRGGAKELGGDNSSFVFKASDKDALIEIWRQLIEGELQPGDFWASAMNLTTMDDHLSRLMELWGNPEAPQLDVRPQVDAADHKTHIQEIVPDEEVADQDVSRGVHLDSHEDRHTGLDGDDDDSGDPDAPAERSTRRATDVYDSNPTTQAANSIPEASKEAAATHDACAALSLDADDPTPTPDPEA